MLKVAFIDDSPLIGMVCEKVLRSLGALSDKDRFDKFINSGAFLQALHHYGIAHYDVVVCDYHLERGENVKGIDVLERVLFLGYRGAAILYSADNDALAQTEAAVGGERIVYLAKDAPGNKKSISAIAEIITQKKKNDKHSQIHRR